MKSLSVTCPACAADVGERCRTTTIPGYGFPAVHGSRVNLAKKISKQSTINR